MNIIWYNPDTKNYHLGSQIDYEIQLSNSGNPADMMVLYELDDLNERLANKIVSELNAARTELKSA
ncbi:MAG: hypothetical protein ABJN36_03755 [Cyclobacteriaceae bacterium]